MPITAGQPDWHILHQTDPTSRLPARGAAAQLGKQHVHTPETYRTRPSPHVRAVREFPLLDEESTVTIDGHSDADGTGCPKTRRSPSGGSLRIGRHTLVTWSSTQKVATLSSAESEHYSMVRCASEVIGLANTVRELDAKLTYESGQMLQQHGSWLSTAGAAPSNTW